jgi:hypothetical protein
MVERIEAIEIDFLIPEAPGGTFREQGEIGSSLLFDIGCYAVSLLRELRLPLDTLVLTSVEAAGNPLHERYRIEGLANGRAITVSIGVATEYRNEVVCRTALGSARYSPFFYGRAGSRSIAYERNGTIERKVLEDPNAFERMLAVPRAEYLAGQAERLRTMIEVTQCLAGLGQDLGRWRARA